MRLRRRARRGRHGGPTGDLYITVHVNEHEIFERERDDVIYTLPLNVTQAVLGDELEIPTLGGETRLKVPPGTQPGQMFRLKGKGIQRLRGGGTWRPDRLRRRRHAVEARLEAEEAFKTLDGLLKSPT